MKYALISDIHGNLEALSAVKAAAEKRGAEAFVCLGDIVSYGADPVPCLNMIREMAPKAVVRGNHDSAVCGLTGTENFTNPARAAVEWTARGMERADLDYLRFLPLVAKLDDFVLVHANLDQPGEWRYILYPDLARPSFSLLEDSLCFFGHTHRPVCYRRDRSGRIEIIEDAVRVETGYKYLFNAGSVGQPRDGDWRAAFAFFDRDEKTVEVVRVEYDAGAAAEKIRKAGLPRFLADRLIWGT